MDGREYPEFMLGVSGLIMAMNEASGRASCYSDLPFVLIPYMTIEGEVMRLCDRYRGT